MLYLVLKTVLMCYLSAIHVNISETLLSCGIDIKSSRLGSFSDYTSLRSVNNCINKSDGIGSKLQDVSEY
jgi:hypothetical protein